MASTTGDDSIKSKVKAFEATPNVPLHKGAWTQEEDRKLAEAIAVHGAERWKFIAAKAGLNRTSTSCRLRWLNYLRPNIKRGNISDQEEDLILRLHKLLGNRWSLIAGRLPGRTDNEIKNYWNSHLCKKVKQGEKQREGPTREDEKERVVVVVQENNIPAEAEENSTGGSSEDSSKLGFEFDVDGLFNFSEDDPLNLEWVSLFLEFD